METTEQAFRANEKQLDFAMNAGMEALVAAGICAKDASIRSYHYKADYLAWEYTLSKEWEMDLESWKVSVSFMYAEPALVEEPPLVTVDVRAEKYCGSNESHFDKRERITVPMDQFIAKGASAVALQGFQRGAEWLGL